MLKQLTHIEINVAIYKVSYNSGACRNCKGCFCLHFRFDDFGDHESQNRDYLLWIDALYEVR